MSNLSKMQTIGRTLVKFRRGGSSFEVLVDKSESGTVWEYEVDGVRHAMEMPITLDARRNIVELLLLGERVSRTRWSECHHQKTRRWI